MRLKGLFGAKGVSFIAGLTFLGLSFIIFPNQLNAQVTIKERMELKKTDKDDASTGQLSQTSSSGERILHRLAPGQYIVLKTGWLRFYTGQATTATHIQQPVEMTRSGFESAQDTSLTIANHFVEPIGIIGSEVAACPEEYHYDRQAGYTLLTHKDADTQSGQSQFLFVGSGEQSYVEFTLGQVTTNGVFERSSLGLTVQTQDTTDAQSFRIAPVLEHWDETDLIFGDPLPAAGTGVSRSLEAVTNGFTTDFDVSSIVSRWVSGSLENNGFNISPAASQSIVFRSSENTVDNASDVEPRLGIRVTNPNAPLSIAQRRVEAGYVQAGDTLTFDWRLPDLLSAGNSRDPDFPSLQRIIFEGNPTGCFERMELFVDMAEDTTRTPYMQVEVIPDTTTIAPGDTVGITPKLRFESGRVADFPFFQSFSVGLTQGDTLGTLVEEVEKSDPFDPDPGTGDQITAGLGFGFIADTAADSPSAVTIQVNTEVYRPGFIAGEAPPGGEEPKAIPLQASSLPASQFGGVSIAGTGQVVIQKDSLALSIELPDSAQVWPTVRARDGGNPGDRNIEKEITVSLLRNGQAVADQPVNIRTFRIKGSGGHDHELSGGSPDREQLGRFIFEGDTTEVELETETDADGKIEFDYQSSIFSGEYVFKAATFIDGDSLFARGTLTIRVPDLILLEEDTTYVLSGGTCNHHGPERPGNPIPARCESPDQIHYTTEAAKDSLVAAAKEYLNGKWNTENEKIRVNDISLSLGGYFDINGNWRGDHVSHRTGEDVDIENISNLDNLKKAFSRNGWEFIPHDGTGFFPHFRLDN